MFSENSVIYNFINDLFRFYAFSKWILITFSIFKVSSPWTMHNFTHQDQFKSNSSIRYHENSFRRHNPSRDLIRWSQSSNELLNLPWKTVGLHGLLLLRIQREVDEKQFQNPFPTQEDHWVLRWRNQANPIRIQFINRSKVYGLIFFIEFRQPRPHDCLEIRQERNQ